MALPFLETLGLTQNESNLYEQLLKLGEVPAWKILQEVKLPRATAYKSLYSLEKKGLVTKADKGKTLHFKPEPPTKLLELAEGQYKELDRARKDVQSLLPDLTSSYILSVEKPVVTTFEGVEGLKKIYDDQVAEGKLIRAVQNTAVVDPTLFAWLTKTHVKQRVKAGIPARVIVASGKWAKEYESLNEKEMRETITVPSDKFPFQHGFDVYGTKVAFINYNKDEPLIGVVVNHPSIAITMEALFDLAWKGAEQVNSQQTDN